MKLCPNCKSDLIERTSSTGLRVIGCIILLFIPLGIFLCWIPFVLPHTYKCKVCGKEGNTESFLHIDWREREKLLESHKLMEQQLMPLLDRWLQEEKYLSKIVKAEGQLLLVRVAEESVDALNIVDYRANTFPPALVIRDDFQVNLFYRKVEFYTVAEKEKPVIELNSLGQKALSEGEFSLIIDALQEKNLKVLQNGLEKSAKFITAPIKVEVSRM